MQEILITTGNFPGKDATFVRNTYIRTVAELGFAATVVTPDMGKAAIVHHYKKSVGVIGTGGNDFDPSTYGQERNGAQEPFDPARDEMELTIINWANEDDKPLLGVCRIFQGMAIATGGDLLQHIPEGEIIHPVDDYEDLPKNTHVIFLAKGSRIREIYDASEIVVNSGHHQGVANSGKMTITARAPDGIAEAGEIRGKLFMQGTQFHLEKMGRRGRKMVNAFADAARLYAA